ncbi:hypothetical protein V5F89_12505 [Pelagerythrobacter marensis]|uniref:Uncharacterized protein n=1 Tax=Pelagerythrobacter marensis TaxID=543877 RepID=A0ABZ2D762_9SPHN
MAVGLRIWDTAGNLIFDENTRITRYLGSGSTGTADGSISDAKLAESGAAVWWRFIGSATPPVMLHSGTNLSWQWDIPLTYRTSRTFVYGLF